MQKKREELEQQKQLLEFETIFNTTAVGIIELRNKKIINRINKRGCEILGYQEDELIGKSSELFFVSDENYSEFVKKYFDTLTDGNTIQVENQLKKKDSSNIWCSLFGRAINPPLLDEGIILVLADITERKEMQEKLLYLASTDSLTGICNHRSFYEKANDLFYRASRFSKPLSILVIDVDDFKKVNDTYGHDAGDRLLKMMCENCRTLIRDIDIFGRIGGEEFAVILEEATSGDALIVAERIRGRIESLAMKTGGERLSFTISIGISSIKAGDLSLNEMVKRADNALYRAKRDGKNRVEFS